MEGENNLLILGIENPLLDISMELKNDELLKKYKLEHGQASLASDEQLPLYDELWKMEGRQTIPGGSTLNSIRSANYMLKDKLPNKCGYFGCIGND